MKTEYKNLKAGDTIIQKFRNTLTKEYYDVMYVLLNEPTSITRPDRVDVVAQCITIHVSSGCTVNENVTFNDINKEILYENVIKSTKHFNKFLTLDVGDVVEHSFGNTINIITIKNRPYINIMGNIMVVGQVGDVTAKYLLYCDDMLTNINIIKKHSDKTFDPKDVSVGDTVVIKQIVHGTVSNIKSSTYIIKGECVMINGGVRIYGIYLNGGDQLPNVYDIKMTDETTIKVIKK